VPSLVASITRAASNGFSRIDALDFSRFVGFLFVLFLANTVLRYRDVRGFSGFISTHIVDLFKRQRARLFYYCISAVLHFTCSLVLKTRVCLRLCTQDQGLRLSLCLRRLRFAACCCTHSSTALRTFPHYATRVSGKTSSKRC